MLLSLSHCCPYINLVTGPVQRYPNNNAVTSEPFRKIVFRVIHRGKQTFVCVCLSKAISDSVIMKCKILAKCLSLFFLDLALPRLFEVNVLLKGKVTFLQHSTLCTPHCAALFPLNSASLLVNSSVSHFELRVLHCLSFVTVKKKFLY